MSVSLVGSTLTPYAVRSDGVTFDKPTEAVAGDYLVATVWARYLGEDIAVPEGFIELARTPPMEQSPGGFAGLVQSFGRVLTGSEGATFTFPFNGTRQSQVVCFVVRGGYPLNVSVASGTGAASSAPAVEVTHSDGLLVYLGSDWEGSGVLTPPAGFTEHQDSLLYLASKANPAVGTHPAVSQTNGNNPALGYPWSAQLCYFRSYTTKFDVGVDFVANTGAFVGEPEVVAGDATVLPDFLDTSAQVYTPIVVPLAQQIIPAYVQALSQVYAPSVVLRPTLLPTFVEREDEVYTPAIHAVFRRATPHVWNGEEWVKIEATPPQEVTETLEDIIASLDSVEVQLVAQAALITGVETHGSNANGNWVRFSNGLQICWQNANITLAVTTVYGSLYMGTYTWTFPQPFIDMPSANSSLLRANSTGGWCTAVGYPSTTSAAFRALDVISRASGAGAFSGFAIGKWK